MARRVIATGAHTHLTTYTRVLNPSRHRLTQQQDQEYKPKRYDESAMG
jgi:hypothetical protein